jgi:2-hydroxychromene-2-carboxylate isomerase
MSTPAMRWYFDVLSPCAWLQWPAVRRWAATQPTVAVADALHWGEDQTGLVDALLADPGLAADPEYRALERVPVGVVRRR